MCDSILSRTSIASLAGLAFAVLIDHVVGVMYQVVLA